jgi:hypothetical protein
VTKRESDIENIKKIFGKFFEVNPPFYLFYIMIRARRKNAPYWNFWRVIFAGWIIRYPGTFFKIIGVPFGIMIVLIYNSVMN